MSSLVNDASNREAVGAAAVITGIEVVIGEVQAVSASTAVGCGHPVVAVRANVAELTCIVDTQAAGREERYALKGSPCRQCATLPS